MSSSDKFPDWSVFQGPTQTEQVDILSPASEVASDLRKMHKKLAITRENVERAHREGIELVIPQAVLVYKFSKALDMYETELKGISNLKKDIYKHLRILKDQMLDTLTKSGYEIIEPVGESFDNVCDSVHVQHWRHHEEYLSEVVAEVLEPIIKHNGKIVELGRVVMGAPPVQVDDK